MVYSKSTAPTAHTNVMSSTVTVERRLRGRERFACFCVMICISSFGFICRSVFVGFADFVDFIGRARVMTTSVYSRRAELFQKNRLIKLFSMVKSSSAKKVISTEIASATAMPKIAVPKPPSS